MSSIQDKSVKPSTDSASEVKEFFNNYFTKKISFTSNEVDAVIGFFEKRGFDKTAAISISSVLLQQAKVDNVNIFKLLDGLKGLTNIQLTKLVATILNANRSKVSNIGFKIENATETLEKRNINL